MDTNGAMNDQTQESRIRLVLFEDHGLFRAGLGRLLAAEPDLEVAGECSTSAEVLEVLKKSVANVVLLDFDVGTEYGNDLISAARKAGFQGRFLVVTGSTDVRQSAIALKRGASGIFLSSQAPDRLVQAIRFVCDGGIWVDQNVIQLLADQLIEKSRLEDQRSSAPLEDRERNVLLGILEGFSNRKIGDNIGLSESSVKNTVQQLFRKAGVKTRGQLVRVALEGTLFAAQVVHQQPNEIANGAPLKSSERWPTTANLPGKAISGQSHQ